MAVDLGGGMMVCHDQAGWFKRLTQPGDPSRLPNLQSSEELLCCGDHAR